MREINKSLILVLVIVSAISWMKWSHVGSLVAQVKKQHAVILHQEEELRIANLNLTADECFQVRKGFRQDRIRVKILQINPSVKEPVLTELVGAVHKYSLEYDLDPDLILAVALAESNLNPRAVSPVGALGIMQVMPFWVDQLEFISDPNELFLVDKNVRAGSFILREYINMYKGNKNFALLAYNRGPGAILSSIRNGEDPDNGYPRMVLASYSRIRRIE